MSRPPLRSGEFIPLVALLMSLVAIAIDAILPALPAVGENLGVRNQNDVQFVITALLLGLGFGQILFGPLSDRIGRKPAIQAGLCLFMAGCVMSIFASNFEVMIAGRVLQGIGVAGPRVIIVALVRDQYEGRQMARLMSFAMTIFVLVPTVAPALGQAILWLGGWRSIFLAFLILALVALTWFSIRQPETLPVEKRRPLSPRAVGNAIREVLRTRTALGFTIANGCVLAPFVAYLSTCQQIFGDVYDTGALFPLWFGVLALATGGATLTNGRLVIRHGMRRLSMTAAVSVTVISTVSGALTFVFGGLPPFWFYMAFMFGVFVCIGLLFGNLNALAMTPLGHIAGVGAAVVAFLSTSIAVPFGALLGRGFDGTMYLPIGAFALFGGAAIIAMIWADGGSREDQS